MSRRASVPACVLLAGAVAVWWRAQGPVRVSGPAAAPPPQPITIRDGGQSVLLQGVRVTLRHRGMRQATIELPGLAVHRDGQLLVGSREVTLALWDGGPPLTVTAGQIGYDVAAEVLWLDRGVDIVGAKDQRLRADRVRYDPRGHVVVATGNVVVRLGEVEIRAAQLRVEQGLGVVIADGNVVVRRGAVELSAVRLRYLIAAEIAEASGGVRLSRPTLRVAATAARLDARGGAFVATGAVEVVVDGATITGAEIRYTERPDRLVVSGDVTVTREGHRLVGRRLEAVLPERRLLVEGETTLRQRVPGASTASGASEEIALTASRIALRWDVGDVEAEGGVVIAQPGRLASAERMRYSASTSRVLLVGRVVLEQTPAADATTDGEPRRPFLSAWRLRCSALSMSLVSRDAVAEGPIEVLQGERSVVADRASYAHTTQRLVLQGRVTVAEPGGRRLRADRVAFSLADGTYEAEGNVESEFVLRPLNSGP